MSDHLSLVLAPEYISKRKKGGPVVKTVKCWPEGAIMQLQDCFEQTNWDVFEHQDLEQYTAAVLGYMAHCIDTVTTNKCIRSYPNQKPWMTGTVRSLLYRRNKAFKSGDASLYSVARANLRRGIKQAKAAYKAKIEDCLSNNNLRQAWQGIQQLTNYKAQNVVMGGKYELAEELNTFYARFEMNQPEVELPSPLPLPTQHHAPLVVKEHDVRCMMKAVNSRKAAGPDNIPGCVVKECADQLAGVWTEIFNRSLLQSIVPNCLKASIIVPVPKKSPANALNDYRPVALTSVIMKCFEQLVRKYIISCLPVFFDNYQFAYRKNRSTEDAVNTVLHTALSHLEKKGTYVRILFVDFSSAFNTIVPHRLLFKLKELKLPDSICWWILDFLTHRSQRVRMNEHISSVKILNTGTPQGCVLSPLLFTIYTSDCTSIHLSNKIIKFADDTTLVGLISDNDESAYRDEVHQLSLWCKANNLIFNISKTKEFIVDYRKSSSDIQPLYIEGGLVERVAECKFLGITLKQDLTWGANTLALEKKAQQRLYFLRLLRLQQLSESLLVAFYRSSIESILSYCLCVWFMSCTGAEKKALQRVIKRAQKIIGCPLPSLEDLYNMGCSRKIQKILRDSSHPGHSMFEILPSGRRYRVLKARTSRFKHSFYPSAVIRLNAEV